MAVRDRDPLQVGRRAAERVDRLRARAARRSRTACRRARARRPSSIRNAWTCPPLPWPRLWMPGASSVTRAERCQGANGFATPSERGLELGEVAQQQRAHRVVLDPVDAFLRVDLGPVVAGEEAVASSRRDAIRMKMRKAVSLKPKPFGFCSAYMPDHRVDLLGVAVDAPQVLRVLGRVGHLLEGVVRLQVQEPAELVVARHAALADAQDVDRGEVDERAVGLVEVLQEAREVVQRDRARVRGPERVEQRRPSTSPSAARARAGRRPRAASAPAASWSSASERKL